MEQLTKNQAVATSQEAVQNQNEPQLRDENAHNDKTVHGVLNPTYQAGLRRDAVQPDIEVFFFNDTATTEIYTLSLHDALPISPANPRSSTPWRWPSTSRAASSSPRCPATPMAASPRDRKSTRLNSSHANISYAVFCLKKIKLNAVQPDIEAERKTRAAIEAGKS